MKKLDKSKLFSVVKLLVPLIIFMLVFMESRHFFKGLNMELLKNQVANLGITKFLVILLVGLTGVLPMYYYDVILVKLLKISIPRRNLFKYAFIANTYSNFLGLGGITGAALRSYFFKNKEDKGTILKAIAKISLFYLTGLSLLCWFVLFGILKTPVFEAFHWIKIAIFIISLYLPILFITLYIKNKKNLDTYLKSKIEIGLVLVSVGEWFFALLIIWAISKVIGMDISFMELAPIYIIAASAGVVSMIPGGLGSFDLIFLISFQSYHIPKEQILLLLLLYRISYHFFPWVVGTLLLLHEFWKTLNKKWNQIPEILIRHISHWILTILVFVSGVILLISAALPSVISRVKFLEKALSTPLISLSHQLSVAAGITLLVLSRGIEYKVKWVYYLTITVLLLGSVFTFAKGFDYEEAFFVLAVALILWMSRGRFYRENFVITWGKAIFDFFTLLVFVGMYFVIGYLNLPNVHVKIPHKLQPLIIMDSRELFTSGLIGLIIAVAIMVLGYIIRKPAHFSFSTTEGQIDKMKEHLDRYGGTVLSHLLFLHDKYIHWNKEENVLFAFQKYADKIVILGDPIGDKDQIYKAIEELQEEADRFGLTPVYYQVTKEMLPYLHGNGYDFFKLGEEAFVNLETFSLSGSKMKGLRAIKNKFERENYHFEVISPPFSSSLMNELRRVSDSWLGGRKEKGFSLGFFNEEYMNQSPIALLKKTDGTIIGFATIMPMYDKGRTISIDLMRFLPHSPNGTMDYIFMSLFEWAKEQNFTFFNVGMAPLANVGQSKYSFMSEKIASQIYLYGQFIYHFKGLKRFKEKYASIWEPKYLGYRRKSSLPFTMIQLTFLISRKVKKNQK